MTNGIISVDNPDNYPIVIIHPGSLNLRFGYSTSTCPITIPHCIGRRRRFVDEHRHEDDWLSDPCKESPESQLLREVGIKSGMESLCTRHVNRNRKRKMTNHEHILESNRNSEVVSEIVSTDRQSWTSCNNNLQFLIGKEAFLLAPDSPFNIHWPWRGGGLNIHKNVGGSISSVIQDLHDIWTTAFNTHLSINHTNVKYHRAVLILPDTYKRSDVRELVELLLNKISFHSIFVTQESVCATFEEGLTCGCVVDVGDRKTSICCVEDGMIKSNTMVMSQLGGSDITICFYWLLVKNGFPLKDIAMKCRFDAMFVRELKETYCHLDQNIEGTKEFNLSFQRPSSSSPSHCLKCKVKMGDERIFAPMSFFFPEMLGSKVNKVTLIFGGGEKVSDPSDVNDDEYLQQTMTKHEIAARQRRRDQTEASNQMQESGMGDDSQLNDYEGYDSLELNTMKTNQLEDEFDTWNLIGLHQCIIKIIERCESEEVKQKMYSNILLVGGGAMFMGVQSHLTNLIQQQLANQMRAGAKTYEVNVLPKESSDLTITAWKGGCIMSCLDTSQELWVTARLWNKYGVRALRERIPFNW